MKKKWGSKKEISKRERVERGGGRRREGGSGGETSRKKEMNGSTKTGRRMGEKCMGKKCMGEKCMGEERNVWFPVDEVQYAYSGDEIGF